MFKKITITTTILIISVILLCPVNSFAQRGGGRGGGGGGGTDFTGRGGFNPAPIDVNSFKKSKLLTYLVDANNVKVDPNTLSAETLQTLYLQIGMGDRGGVIDLSKFPSTITAQGNTRGGRGDPFGMSSEITDPNDTDPLVQVNLNGVDISSIIRILIQWTNKAVVPTGDAQNLVITAYSPTQMKRSEALSLLYAVMREYGFIAETVGNIIYIKPYSQATKTEQPFYGPEVALNEIAAKEDKDTIVRKVYKIKNYSPSAMGQLILPFIDSYGYVTAEESTGTLMISDSVKTLLRVDMIIQQFDIDLAQTVTETLMVQHRDPEEMATLLESIMSSSSVTATGALGGMNMGMMGGMQNMMTTANRTTTTPTRTTANTTATRGGRGQAAQQDPRSRVQQNNRGGNMGAMSMLGTAQASAMTVGSSKPAPVFIPDASSKIIIARALPEDMVTIKYWLAKLDTKATIVWNPEQLASLDKNVVVEKFYYLQYNSPQRIAQIVEPLLTDAGYLSAEEDTGTLMIIDTAGTLMQLEGIIKQFDVPQSQTSSQQIFDIKYQDPRELVNLINLILSGDTNISGTSGTQRSSALGTNRTTTNRTAGRTGTTTARTTGMGGRGG